MSKMKEYTFAAALGAGSFVLAFLVSNYIFEGFQINVPYVFYLLFVFGLTVFCGLSPPLIYSERSINSFRTAALITLGYLGALLIASEFAHAVNIVLMRSFFDKYWWWATLPGFRYFLNPLLVIFNGLLSISFGLLVLVLRRIRKEDTCTVIALFFIIVTISTGVPSALMLWGMKGAILNNGIFGALLSMLVRFSFVVDRLPPPKGFSLRSKG